MTRVLVVDDSPLMRRLLGDILRGAEGFEVTFARNGLEALEALHAAPPPDVITLDVQMPEMDGLACLDRIMLERPTPVVMISALTADGAAETLEALSLGAIDVITKPSGAVSLELETLGPQIVETLRNAAGARLRRTHRLTDRVRSLTRAAGRPEPAPSTRPQASEPIRTVQGTESELPGVVLVGCSTGGPPALDALLAPLPADFPLPIVVAQHMPRTFTGALARRLDGLCALTVCEVDRPTLLAPGHVYIARGDGDLILSARPGGIHLVPAPASAAFRWHPSVERLVESALGALPPDRLIGVLMTGMGNDGAVAMARLHETGGFTMAEAEETAVVWGMPGDLVRRGGASLVSPLDDLAQQLLARVAA